MDDNRYEVVIVAAKRSAMGSFLGQFHSVSATDLAAPILEDCMNTTGLSGQDINEVLLGCVLPAGQGQAPARQATLKAKLPHSVGATTINKVCGSGMKAVMLAHNAIALDPTKIIFAGGMESMSQAPYVIKKARTGIKMGHQNMLDHMFIDGLEDAYTGKSMGSFAQQHADEIGFTRSDQDQFALRSLAKAKDAIQQGLFLDEIVPIHIKTKKAEVTITEDEQPSQARPEKIAELKPAFSKEGTITAANSSSISDGAAALLLMSADEAQKRKLPILAKIKASTTYSCAPEKFTSAPVGAINQLLSDAQWSTDDVDLYEINEAFAMVTMLAIKQLELPSEKVNIYGGACALGHPIGCSGARILVTLIHALRRKGLHKGVASLCIGGGEATAMAIEVV